MDSVCIVAANGIYGYGKRGGHRSRVSKKFYKSQIRKLLKENAALKAKLRGPMRGGFYDSNEWRQLRYRALKQYGRKCACCGSDAGPFHVDHIKPRSLFPLLALDIKNLQVLCKSCNLGKGNTDSIQWRQT